MSHDNVSDMLKVPALKQKVYQCLLLYKVIGLSTLDSTCIIDVPPLCLSVYPTGRMPDHQVTINLMTDTKEEDSECMPHESVVFVVFFCGHKALSITLKTRLVLAYARYTSLRKANISFTDSS